MITDTDPKSLYDSSYNSFKKHDYDLNSFIFKHGFRNWEPDRSVWLKKRP